MKVFRDMKTDWDVDVTVIKQLWFEAGTTTKKKT